MDKIARGYQADQLLQNALLKECLNGLDEYYCAVWRKSKSLEAREDAHRYVTLLTKLVQDLQSISTTGKLEDARLKELEGKRGIIAWPKIV